MVRKINSQLEDLTGEVNKIKKILNSLTFPKATLEKEVKIFGNGAHITLSKSFLKKKAKIIIE